MALECCRQTRGLRHHATTWASLYNSIIHTHTHTQGRWSTPATHFHPPTCGAKTVRKKCVSACLPTALQCYMWCDINLRHFYRGKNLSRGCGVVGAIIEGSPCVAVHTSVPASATAPTGLHGCLTGAMRVSTGCQVCQVCVCVRG